MTMIPSLTKDNHFKFGYDNQWFIPRTNSSQRFTVAFGRTQKPADWRTECIQAASEIAKSTDLPIHVLYSGGIDSEVTLLSFLRAGISVTADVMRFTNGTNQHDIKYALDFCHDHNVNVVVHDLDIIAFMGGEMYDYAALTHCVSPQLCATMWLVDQIEGYPVIGQGECVLVRENGQWYFRESEKINSWYRHFLLRNREGVPGFHQYTPAQMLSYLLDPVFLSYMHPESGKTSNKSTKYLTYSRYFDLRPRPKYTGFEYLEEHDTRHRDRLLSLYGDWNDAALFEFPEFVQCLQY